MAKKTSKSKTGTKKTAAKAASVTTAATANDLMHMPPEGVIVRLVKKLFNLGKNVQEITGEMSQAVSNAADAQHVDKKALSIVRGLAKMSDKKLAITLLHLLYYIDALKLHERASAQGDLEKVIAEKDEGEEADLPETRPRRGLRTIEGGGQPSTFKPIVDVAAKAANGGS